MNGVPQEPKTFRPAKDHNFSDAAFNSTGQFLYAWAYGTGFDSLYLWEITEGIVDVPRVYNYDNNVGFRPLER